MAIDAGTNECQVCRYGFELIAVDKTDEPALTVLLQLNEGIGLGSGSRSIRRPLKGLYAQDRACCGKGAAPLSRYSYLAFEE